MSKATPRPWEADDVYVIGRVRGGRPNGETIYGPYRHGLPREEQLANAALVARAVNAWDDKDALISRVAELEGFTVPDLCNRCGGSGRGEKDAIDDKASACTYCKGTGRADRTSEVQVKESE